MLDRSDWKEEKDQQGHAEVLTHRKRLQQAVLFGHGVFLSQASEFWDYRSITTPISILNLDSLKTTELSKFLRVSVVGVCITQFRGGTRESYSRLTFQPASIHLLHLIMYFSNFCYFHTAHYETLFLFTWTPVFTENFCCFHISPVCLMELFDETSKGFSRQKHYSPGSLWDLSGTALASCLSLSWLQPYYPGLHSTLFYATEK